MLIEKCKFFIRPCIILAGNQGKSCSNKINKMLVFFCIRNNKREWIFIAQNNFGSPSSITLLYHIAGMTMDLS